MRAVIDSLKSSFVRCLIENGDLITLHKNLLPEGIKEGDILSVKFEFDQEATKHQRELIDSFKPD